MKLPGIISSLRLPSALGSPPKFLSDIPQAFKIAREHGWHTADNEQQAVKPRIRMNFMQPRHSIIVDNIYTSIFWRVHQMRTKLHSEKTTFAQKVAIIFASSEKHKDPYRIKVWTLHSLIHFTAQKWLASAVHYSGRGRMIRMNLLERPAGAYPVAMQYLTSARFAAGIMLQPAHSS